ncbi:c-type cytochrome [Sphingosinicella sp. LHD-64]|uniref:c-type cytochrome n=1 Tax=Sphingosinicella sp. LHD-64 TaxID=3072139 RepID=UPI00280FEA16|nr:c-type cytochrome [Sphingosinicella sp. LHD-64]MDQ8756283.1 c-type cytochrome [Sphingosinicella sp. LHD-64]
MHWFVCLSVGLIALSRQGPGTPAAPPAPGPDPGQALVEAHCAGCHSLSLVTGARRTEAQWAETVTRMRDYGAEMSDEESSRIVAFLTRTQGPE